MGFVLETKELELEMVLGLSAVRATLHTEVSRLRCFVKTLDPEGRKVVMLTQNVRELVANPENIQAVAEALRKPNMRLTSDIRKKVALSTVEWARLKALDEELVSVK